VNPNIFLLKKIVGSFFQPIPLCFSLLLLGLIFLIFTRKKKTWKNCGQVSEVSNQWSGVRDQELEGRAQGAESRAGRARPKEHGGGREAQSGGTQIST